MHQSRDTLVDHPREWTAWGRSGSIDVRRFWLRIRRLTWTAGAKPLFAEIRRNVDVSAAHPGSTGRSGGPAGRAPRKRLRVRGMVQTGMADRLIAKLRRHFLQSLAQRCKFRRPLRSFEFIAIRIQPQKLRMRTVGGAPNEDISHQARVSGCPMPAFEAVNVFRQSILSWN